MYGERPVNTILLAMVLGAQTPPPPPRRPIMEALDNGNWVLAESLLRQGPEHVQLSGPFYWLALAFTLEKLDRRFEAYQVYRNHLLGNSDQPANEGEASKVLRGADFAREFGDLEYAARQFRRMEIQRYSGSDRNILANLLPYERYNLPGEALAAYFSAYQYNKPTQMHEWPGMWRVDLAARAVRLAPNWPHAWHRLAEQLSQDGWKNKAWVAYQEAVKRYPLNDRQRQEALNRIKSIEMQPRRVEIEDGSDPTGYRMVNVELPGKRFRDGKNPNPRSNIAWPLPGPVPPDWH
jgi:hypothetical protein